MVWAPARAAAPEPFDCDFGFWVNGWRGQVECAFVEVPENHDRPQDGPLNIAIYTLRPTAQTDAAPVIYLAGGPGVGVAYYVNQLLRHPLRGERPIVIIEQRGIGRSGELCPSVRGHYYRRVASRRSNEMRDRQFIGVLQRCFRDAERRGRAVEAYTTQQNAQDLELIREALGLDELDLWAVSYGTIMAQAYMRLVPERVGRTVMDSSVPIDHALEGSLVATFRSSLETHWQACVDTGECDEAGPSYMDRLNEIIPLYDQQPLRLIGFSPEPSLVVNSVYITGRDAWGIIFTLLYDALSISRIDRVLTLLEQRSTSFIRAHYQRLVIPGFSYGMHFAVNCRGPLLSATGQAEVFAAEPVYAAAAGIGFLPELCANAGLPMAEAQNEPVSFDGPVLLVSGTWDPVTPPAISERLRSRFTSSQWVEVAEAGHGPTRSVSCAQDLLTDFFAGRAERPEQYC